MPVSVPAVPQLKVNGKLVSNAVDQAIVEVTIRADLGTVTHARVCVDGADDHGGAFVVGKAIEVAAVVSGSASALFTGTIVAVGIEVARGRKELVIDAYDQSFQLAQRTVTKVHVKASYQDVVKSIASDFGLSANVTADIGTVRYEQIHQYGTPHRFLSDVCRLAGCEWYVADKKLVVRKRKADAKVQLGVDRELRRFSARFASNAQTAEVTVRGWDAKTKQATVGTATRTPPSGRPTVMTTTPDAKAKATTWAPHTAGKDDAEAFATGIVEAMTAAEVTGSGELIDVDARIKPGVEVDIKGVNAAWNGCYYVSGVEHHFSARQSFMTRFAIGGHRPDSLVDLVGTGGGESSSGRFTNGLTIGLVTNIDDQDEKLNRVKISLPYLADDLDIGWARVVQPGAGAKRGFLAHPEVGDEVVVGFEHGDVRRPFVLGGLWNGKDAPPTAGPDLLDSGKVAERSWTSRSDHRITIGDGGKQGDRITLALGTKKVELWLGAEEIRLQHEDDVAVTISNKQSSVTLAKGGKVTIKGKDVAIEASGKLELKGATVEVKGDSKLEASGAQVGVKATGKLDLQASGITAVKGSMVQIN